MLVAAAGHKVEGSMIQIVIALQAQSLYEKRERDDPPSVRRLLHHAVKTVPYYQASANVDTQLELHNFPIITRTILNERGSEFLSSSFAPDERFPKSTSGSTGIPLVVYRDAASSYGTWQQSWRQFFERTQIKLPRPFSRATVVVNDNPLLSDHEFIIPCLHFSKSVFLILGKSHQRDLAVARAISEMPISILEGRPRGLLRLGELGQEAGVRIRPTIVISGGDNLYDVDRSALSIMYETHIYNSYGSVEAGVIALECQSSGQLHIFSNRAFCEIIDDCGNVQSDGQGQLVNTNLENFAMCFPRYVTGDVVCLNNATCVCGFQGQSISKIEGRISIYFRIGSLRVNPSVFDRLFEAQPIKQFQLTQTGPREFRLYIVPKEPAQDCSDSLLTMSNAVRDHCGDVELDASVVTRIGRPGEKIQRYSTGVYKMAAR